MSPVETLVTSSGNAALSTSDLVSFNGTARHNTLRADFLCPPGSRRSPPSLPFEEMSVTDLSSETNKQCSSQLVVLITYLTLEEDEAIFFFLQTQTAVGQSQRYLTTDHHGEEYGHSSRVIRH